MYFPYFSDYEHVMLSDTVNPPSSNVVVKEM